MLPVVHWMTRSGPAGAVVTGLGMTRRSGPRWSPHPARTLQVSSGQLRSRTGRWTCPCRQLTWNERPRVRVAGGELVELGSTVVAHQEVHALDLERGAVGSTDHGRGGGRDVEDERLDPVTTVVNGLRASEHVEEGRVLQAAEVLDVEVAEPDLVARVRELEATSAVLDPDGAGVGETSPVIGNLAFTLPAPVVSTVPAPVPVAVNRPQPLLCSAFRTGPPNWIVELPVALTGVRSAMAGDVPTRTDSAAAPWLRVLQVACSCAYCPLGVAAPRAPCPVSCILCQHPSAAHDPFGGDDGSFCGCQSSA